MRLRPLVSASVIFLFASFFILNLSAKAQSTTQSSSSGSSAPNSAAAQNSASSQDAGNNRTAAGQPSGGAKRVWTNEDVDSLREDSSISTPSAITGPKQGKTMVRPARANGKNVNWYRGQIARLNAQIPPLDNQIAELQSALDGKPAGDGKKSTRPYLARINDWQTELDDARQKRADISAKIDALRDEARHNGIPANVLP